LAAQAHGAAAVLFVRDVQNHPGPENFEAAASNYWPALPVLLVPYTLASWAEQIAIPIGQISIALAENLVRGSGKSLADLARAAESKRGTPLVAITRTHATHAADV